jgi:hypothetical protein
VLNNGFLSHVTLELSDITPVSFVDVSGDPDTSVNQLTYPLPFIRTGSSDRLVVPQAEGILYEVDDLQLTERYNGYYVTYNCIGLTMPFFGGVNLDSGSGYLCIFETPDDTAMELVRAKDASGTTVIVPRPILRASKGTLRYARRLRYMFSASGGYVALAKYYRSIAKTQGLFRSLREKLLENPDLDKLIGAAMTWHPVWKTKGISIPRFCRELHAKGVDRFLVYECLEHLAEKGKTYTFSF